MDLRRPAALLGFVIGLGALALQFGLTVPLRMEAGHDLIEALVFFFSFFTILTNLMLVLVYLSELTAGGWLGWFRSPATRATMAAAIVLVMGFYHLLLAQLWVPEGLFLVADLVLHYVTPVYYVVWWLCFQPHGALRLRHLPLMLLPPAIYLVYIMVRGAVILEYPYPILDAYRLGYAQVALNVAMVLVGLLLLCALLIAADRLLGRARRG
jgi:hypothetical protein